MKRLHGRALVALLGILIVLGAGVAPAAADGEDVDCARLTTGCPTVSVGNGSANVSGGGFDPGTGQLTSAPSPDYAFRYLTPCEITDSQAGACSPADFPTCDEVPDRVIAYYIVERRPLVRADGTAIDTVVPAGRAVGDPVGDWTQIYEGCIDLTDLDPPPTPDEVYRYFQTLPLPTLTTQQQPPGRALVGLPVLFYTDAPATQPFTVDIRGFTVTITATVTTYTWHPGDGSADIISTDPGAPYPNQTVTHNYSSGTYTASMTATWGADYSVDGGPTQQVPGTTTTDGPPVTFQVVEAHAVLTNPYD